MKRRKAAPITVEPTRPVFPGGRTPGISSGGKNGNAISAHPTTAIQKSGEDFTSTGARERTIRKATTSIKLNKTIAAPDAYGEAWNSGTRRRRAMPALVRRSITASGSRSASTPNSLDRWARACSLPQWVHRAPGRETSTSTASPPSRSWNRTCAKARLDTSSVAWQSVHSKLVRRACMRLLDFGIPSCTPSRSVASKSGYGPRVSWESGQRRHGRPRHDTRTGPPDPSTSFRAGVSSFPQTRQVSLSRLRRLERDWPRSRPGPTTGTTFYLSAFECLVPIWPDWRSQLSRSG